MNRIFALVAALPLVLFAACGTSDQAGDHSAADVTFVQQMLPHHEQAVEMADMVERAGASADVQTLAGQIKAAQAPEIETMKAWLDDWDESATHDGHDMGSGDDMQMGMMSDDDMSELGTLTGTAFDRAWLTMMIEHHEGAVSMARTELAKGRSADAKELARQIIASQQGEIATMKELLA